MDKPADCFECFVDLRDVHDDLQERLDKAVESGTGIADMSLWVEVSRFVERASATGALLEAPGERRAVQSILNYWDNACYRATGEALEAELAPFNVELAPTLPDKPCPYPGLTAFDEDKAAFFFGREALVGEMIKRLAEGERCLVVVGASGSGKSSAVQAGLLPRLREGKDLQGSDKWQCRVSVPGGTPLHNLASALEGTGVAPAPLAAVLPAPAPVSSSGDGHEAEAEQPPEAGQSPVLLVVDQFEELFTLCKDERERQEFANQLLRLVEAPEPRHIVILTIRVDFEDSLARLPEPLGACRVRVEALKREELHAAIEGPAAEVNLRFEPRVVDDLVAQILGLPAGLPLLQFTLLQLWKQRDHNRITWEVYKKVGIPSEALMRAADHLCRTPQDTETVRHILLKMVRPAYGLEVVSSRVPLADVLRIGVAPDQVEHVLYGMVCEAQLVKLSGGMTDPCAGPSVATGRAFEKLVQEEAKLGHIVQIEVAHEALIRNWKPLREWLVSELTVVRRQRRNTIIFVTVAAMVIAVLLMFIVFSRVSQAAKEIGLREAREVMTAHAAAAGAILETTEDPELGLLLAVEAEAHEVKGKEDVRLVDDALRGALLTSPERISRPVPGAERIILSRDGGRPLVAFTRDGGRLAVAGADGKVSVWNVDGSPVPVDVPIVAKLRATAISPDGSRVGAVTEEGVAYVSDAGLHGAQILSHGVAARDIAFSPGGDIVATAGEDGAVRLWDAATRTITTTAAFAPSSSPAQQPVGMGSGSLRWIDRVVFSPNPEQQRLAVIGGDRSVHLWDITGNYTFTLPSEVRATDIAFSPNGDYLATMTEDGTLSLWESDTGQRKSDMPRLVVKLLNEPGAASIAFRQDNRLITTSRDGTVRIWNVLHVYGLEPLVLLDRGVVKAMDAVYVAPTKKLLLATAGDGPVARLWDMQGNEAPAELRHKGDVTSVAFDPQGKRLATADLNGLVYLWDAGSDGGQQPITLTHGARVTDTAIAFDPKGTRLAAGGLNRVVKLWELDKLDSREPLTLSLPAPVAALRFDKDGAHLVISRGDGALTLWELAGNHPVTLTRDAPLVAFSPGGDRLATAGADGAVRLWDMAGKSEVVTQTQGIDITAIAFGPGGRLFIGRGDGTARLWDPRPGQVVTFTHGASINAMAFSPGAGYLATAGKDNTVRLWDSASGRQLAALPHKAEVTRLIFSSDSEQPRRLVTLSADGKVRAWRLETSDLAELAEGVSSRCLSEQEREPYLGEDAVCLSCEEKSCAEREE